MKKIEKGVFIQMEYAGEQRVFEVASLAIQLDHGDTVVHMDDVFEKLHVVVGAPWLLGGLKKGHYKAKRHIYSTGQKLSYKGTSYQILSKQASEEFELTYCLKRVFGNQFIVVTEEDIKDHGIF